MKAIANFSPLKSIRRKCLDCCSNKRSLVRKCEATECSLHLYRFGHNPKRKGISRLKTSQESLALIRTLNSMTSSGVNVRNEEVSIPSVKTNATTEFNSELKVC